MAENAFQDRCLKPLGHPSDLNNQRVSRGRGRVKGRLATVRADAAEAMMERPRPQGAAAGRKS
jgi:hypothetical protein